MTWSIDDDGNVTQNTGAGAPRKTDTDYSPVRGMKQRVRELAESLREQGDTVDADLLVKLARAVEQRDRTIAKLRWLLKVLTVDVKKLEARIVDALAQDEPPSA